ncbi:hypothetical protein JCM3775_005220 [Rhodotorula graminis]|uniref:DH domain-containing protein n=1 Tax=Rhodotorula graminis (strain WP1) TaxID=578459 RepID=A0A0P9EKS1_RHOGW|nr:uncharacterized protein RHOBADRAFT_56102 [Rhodotorula graminis WP1]KPV72290.1 hypothetical protein RHOBADRAFT_56102 [Rhodotorula graminis WP1]
MVDPAHHPHPSTSPLPPPASSRDLPSPASTSPPIAPSQPGHDTAKVVASRAAPPELVGMSAHVQSGSVLARVRALEAAAPVLAVESGEIRAPHTPPSSRDELGTPPKLQSDSQHATPTQRRLSSATAASRAPPPGVDSLPADLVDQPLEPSTSPLATSRSTSPQPVRPNSRSLSSAALAALADSPARPRPPIPPKSSARLSRASTYSSRSRSSSTGGPGGADGSTAGSAGHSRPASAVIDDGALLAVTSMPSGLASSLAHARPRPPSRSQASSRTNSSVYTPSTGALRSSGFLSSSEEGGMTTGGDSSWLGTPATTADYSSAAEGSPSLLPAGHKRQHHVPPLHFDQPSFATSRHGGGIGLGPPPSRLDGLGIAFESPSTRSVADEPQSQPTSGSRPSFDGDGDFARNLDRLSAFAQSLPSPLPGIMTASHAVGEWSSDRAPARDEAARQGLASRPSPTQPSPPDDRTLVMSTRSTAARDGASPSLPPPPPLLPVFAPRPREASAQSTWTTSSVASSRRPSLLHIPSGGFPSVGGALRSQPSLDRLASPAVTEGSEAYYPSMGEETDFLSTDVDADDDDDEDDSFGLMVRRAAAGGGGAPASYRSFSQPLTAESSFATSATGSSSVASATPNSTRVVGSGGGGRGRGNSLWNEDAPAWALEAGPVGYAHYGADGEPLQAMLGASEEDVVDWSDRAIEKHELPTETTHLVLRRCRTPFQIAPLLSLAVPTLAHGLVVLDISDCGMSEVPSAIASCCFLEELSLSGNPLATGNLPSFLGTLPALNVLLADSCNLSTLPSSLAQLGRLHTLTVRGNRLRSLPAWLARLGALDTLLVDDNPFHWQVQNVVRPLFVQPGAAARDADLAVPSSRLGSPLPPLPHEPSSSTSPASRRGSPLPPPPINTTAPSPPLASPPTFHSMAGTPIFAAFSTPPLAASGVVPSGPELAAALESVHDDLRGWDASSGTFPSLTPALTPSLTPAFTPALTPALVESLPAVGLPVAATSPPPPPEPEVSEKKDKRRWNRLLKKVSGTRLRSGSKPPPPSVPLRPGALVADSRTFSQPVTRGEESEVEGKATEGSSSVAGGGAGARMFGSVGRKLKKRSKDPSLAATGTALHGARTAPPSKRKSFLLLDAFSSSPAGLVAPSTLSSPTVAPQNHSAALRSVLAYLRDLDDLSPDVSLPAIPLDTPSSPLRHSPSLGALGSRPGSPAASAAAAVRRAQSTRRLPSYGSGSSSAFRSSSASLRASQAYDDQSPDPSARSPTPCPVAELENSGTKKSADDPVKREAVLKEIVETEQSYLRGLEELCGIYVDSASVPVSSSANGGRRDTVLPSAERRAVFVNIEAIRDFHRRVLLPDLLAAVRGGGDSAVVAGKVGDVFVQHASFMKIYTQYINAFDDALARIQTWAKTIPTTRSRSNTASGAPGASPALASATMFDATAGVSSTLSSSQKKRIKTWLKRARAHPSHSQISLESYLLLPIQRIPRYRLLLETLLSCTPPPPVAPEPSTLAALLDPHAQIAQAVQEMDEVAVALNESKRENEGRAQLVMWQNRLTTRFKSPLVQPHRTLLRSGNLTLVRSVKRSTAPVDPAQPNLYRSANGSSPVEPEEILTLFQETKQVPLIGLLCTDLLVLVKAPSPPLDQDPMAPVELYTVLRLNSPQPVLGSPAGRGDSPASLFGSEDMLRLRVGDKAIVYLRIPAADSAKARKEALQWINAINLQFEVNT